MDKRKLGILVVLLTAILAWTGFAAPVTLNVLFMKQASYSEQTSTT